MTSIRMMLFALFAAFFCFSSVFAADEQYKISDARIDVINSIIVRAVQDREDLTNSAVVQSIYDKVAAEMTLVPSVQIIQVDLKKLNAEARAITEKSFKFNPAKQKKKFTAEAKKKYPMATVKDNISISTKRGFVISGTLHRVTASNVLINSTTVSFIDMDMQTRSRFDAKLNRDLQTQYINERMSAYSLEFSRAQQKEFEKLLGRANAENEKNGYIYLKNREVWKTAKEITTASLDPEIERYKKAKEKQERLRRKREAKELAAKEAREKEAAATAARAAEAEKGKANENAEGMNNNPEGPLPVASEPEQPAANPFATADSKNGEPAKVNPQDIFGTEEKNGLQQDDGGNFIALTPEQLAALSRPKVNEAFYKSLMEKIDKRLEEISNTYYGIDADQGFKKALWGFKEADVYYALSKETEAAFTKKLRINRNDIIYPEGSRPRKIYLHYHLGELCKVEIFVGDLQEHEFNILKNSLRQKYGKSDTQKKIGDDIFDRIIEGTITPDNMPKFEEASVDETGVEPDVPRQAPDAAQNPDNPDPAAGAENVSSAPLSKPFYFVWEGILSRGVLSFYYNVTTKTYEDVIIRKTYLPGRLEKHLKQKAAASATAKKSADEKEAAKKDKASVPAAAGDNKAPAAGPASAAAPAAAGDNKAPAAQNAGNPN